MVEINANLTNYDERMGFDLLPPGWYDATVENSEIKEGPKGAYILWTWAIAGKPNKIWDNMSLGNEVAMKRLKTMAVACGHRSPNYIADTQELHGKTCQVKLKVEEDPTGQYEPKNKISMFKPPTNGNKPIQSQQSVPVEQIPQQKPQQQKRPRMPWE